MTVDDIRNTINSVLVSSEAKETYIHSHYRSVKEVESLSSCL